MKQHIQLTTLLSLWRFLDLLSFFLLSFLLSSFIDL